MRRILASLGLVAASASAGAQPPYAPYKADAANFMYNLLFCDDAAAFRAKPGERPTQWQVALSSDPPDVPALERLALDSEQEGRVRYLAFQRLRQVGQPVQTKELLGVIVEVPLSGGLDTLAAYSDGGVRYINQTGKLAVVEGAPKFAPLAQRLLAASAPVASAIGPWDKARRGPPPQGYVRLTFLVSDGLYFGEGPFSVMQRDQMAGPIIQRATELLQAVAGSVQ
jgi:hypothetical protein